jgi:nitroreductase
MSDTIADLAARRFGLSFNDDDQRPADGAAAVQLDHRTIRRFTDEPVDAAMLRAIVACGLSAPSKSDLQQATIVQVADPGKRAEIAGLIPAMPWIGSAPVFFVLCGDSRRIRRICEMRGKPFANDHLDAFLNAASDAAMVLQSLITAAEAHGLGTCPISVIRNHMARIIDILNLPSFVFPLAGLCIGHPSHPGFPSMRLPPAVTWHVDRYDDNDLADQVDAYDRRRDAVFSIPVEKQKYADEYGVAGFYGWSEDKARQVSKPERDDIGKVLRKQGFSFD